MNNRFKAIYFDMDGTLIRNTNSVQYICTLNGRYDDLMKIEEMEDNKQITWVEADYLKSKLMQGLRKAEIKENFSREISVISGLSECLAWIKENGMKSVLITAGPIDVAYALVERFAFDAAYGSEYEVVDGIFSGKILKHLDGKGKLDGLIDFCQKNGISLDECIAIGDSASDIEVFEKCGKRIALNYSETLINKADEYVITENIIDLIDFIR